MTPSPKICVLGSVNLDLIIQTERLPAAGETVTNGQYTSRLEAKAQTRRWRPENSGQRSSCERLSAWMIMQIKP